MATSIKIRDLATRDIQRAEETLSPEQLSMAGGRAVATRLRDHFQDREVSHSNKRGWPRQKFWSKAVKAVQNPAAATSLTSRGSGAVISINQAGIALLYFGGTVRPIVARMLTIPAAPEAYGQRAKDFSDLVLDRRVNPETGKLQACLVQAQQTAVRLGPKSKKTGLRRYRGTKVGGKVLFWLAKDATIRPDKSVLPTQSELERVSAAAIESTVARIEERRGS